MNIIFFWTTSDSISISVPIKQIISIYVKIYSTFNNTNIKEKEMKITSQFTQIYVSGVYLPHNQRNNANELLKMEIYNVISSSKRYEKYFDYDK